MLSRHRSREIKDNFVTYMYCRPIFERYDVFRWKFVTKRCLPTIISTATIRTSTSPTRAPRYRCRNTKEPATSSSQSLRSVTGEYESLPSRYQRSRMDAVLLLNTATVSVHSSSVICVTKTSVLYVMYWWSCGRALDLYSRGRGFESNTSSSFYLSGSSKAGSKRTYHATHWRNSRVSLILQFPVCCLSDWQLMKRRSESPNGFLITIHNSICYVTLVQSLFVETISRIIDVYM